MKHLPPSVTYPLERSRHLLFAWWCVLVLAGLGHVSLVVYFAGQQAWASAALVVLLAVAMAMLLGWVYRGSLRGPAFSALQWQGGIWQLLGRADAQPATHVEQVQAVIDWQSGMLLRMRNPGTGQALWVCVQAQWAPLYWGDLRRAVHGV